MEVKLTTEHIRTIALFEKVTRVNPKDCIITDSSIYFLVESENMGMAIGKNGINIKELRRITEKHIKIFPYSDDVEEFIRKTVPNVKTFENENGNIKVSVSQEDKLTVIGKGGDNINAIREILKRYFNIQSFKLR